MLNRRQFVQSLLGSLSALIIPSKAKSLSLGTTNTSNIELRSSLFEKLEQDYLLLIPYNQSPFNFVQNINTPIPILTSITDTYATTHTLPSNKTKIWQLHHEKFQADESSYQVWNIRTSLLPSSQIAKTVSVQHWNLWEKRNDSEFIELGTILLSDTGEESLVTKVYGQGGGILVLPSVEVYSYKGNTTISLTQLNEIASRSIHLPM